MVGRKPLPAAIKAINGRSPGRDSGGRLIQPEPQAKPGPPPAPDELQGKAREAWASFIADMDGMGVITHADRVALITLCQAWAEMQDAQKHIEDEGVVIQFPNGVPGANPYCKIREQAKLTVMKLLTEFGLTPSSRSRVKIAPPEEEDEFEEL